MDTYRQRVLVDVSARGRAVRLWQILAGVPLSPDRKERMIAAVIEDATYLPGGRRLFNEAGGDLDPAV